MSSFPQKPPANQKQMKRLLEKYNAREAYDKLAARIILANERTRVAPPSRGQTETRKIKITEGDRHEITSGRLGSVQLPNGEEPHNSPHHSPPLPTSSQQLPPHPSCLPPN